MKKLSQQEIEYLVINHPVIIGITYGFELLGELHNEWIRKMLYTKDDTTLQAHRGSYKTTCVSIALALIIVLFPKEKTLFMRKTDDDVKEVVEQVKKILESDIVQALVYSIYGSNLIITTSNSNEINTNLAEDDPRGTSQLVAIGMGTSITGKHFDRIFTDDIVTLVDRRSGAERKRTKQYYQELQNIKNRGGRIFNTGTPWHKDDAFTIMPKPVKYDCYSTGLISDKELKDLKSKMLPSLFSANYELKHIASEDVIFMNPNVGADPSKVQQGIGHVDASYGGSDLTAFSIGKKDGNTYYIFGKCWHKHVDDCLNDIQLYMLQFNAGKIWCETNADKGYLAKELRKRHLRAVTYHEDMNKYVKITSYLKFAWGNVVFVAGTDEEYIQMILDYTEDAEHDDPPDSCASIIRQLFNKKGTNSYTPIMYG